MKDKIYRWAAYRLPHMLVFWATMRIFVHGTTGKYSDQEVPALTVTEALQRWGHK